MSINSAQAGLGAFHNMQLPVVGAALAGFALCAMHIAGVLEMRLVWTFLVGGMLGFALYRASFGFTGAWRKFIVTGQSRGFRATLVMLGASALFLMPMSTLGGFPPAVAQVSLSLMLGAFVFGFGMQLGGACGSGAAYVVGGGSARTLFTLATFILGSVIGSVHTPFWMAELPKFGALRVTDHVGLAGGLALTLAALAGLWALALRRESRMGVAPLPPTAPGEGPLLERLLLKPWGPFAGAAAIGALAGLALAVSGTMWGITFGYTLWGAQLFEAFGADLSTWTFPGDERAFWAAGWAQGALNQSFFQNVSANMNVGLILGAMLAAGLSGGWRPSLKGVSALSILAALIGGFLMGYGARMSYGCTIGALTNGIASGSVHGWVWMGCAYLGTVLGVRARPLFGLER